MTAVCLKPQTWVLKASTLPLDHRSHPYVHMLLYVKTAIKPGDISVAKFDGSHMLSADDPSGDVVFYVVVYKGYHKITVSMHIL